MVVFHYKNIFRVNLLLLLIHGLSAGDNQKSIEFKQRNAD